MKDAALLLTPREKEVMDHLSRGLSYKEIAHRLDVSHETVKMHLKNIYRKLRVQNKIEALMRLRIV